LTAERTADTTVRIRVGLGHFSSMHPPDASLAHIRIVPIIGATSDEKLAGTVGSFYGFPAQSRDDDVDNHVTGRETVMRP